MKKNFFSTILIVFLMSLFFSCSSLFEKPEMGNISITLPSRAVTSADTNTSIDIDSLEFTITITNYDTKKVITDIGMKGKTYSYELSPGLYDIVISAYLSSAPKNVIYEGKYEKAEIIAGKSTDVFITLKKVIAEPDEPEIPDEPENPDEPEDPKEEFNTWTIDISDIVGDGYIADNSEYGDERYCYYQSGAFDISSCFKDGLPKKDDVLNLKWKGKCDSNIQNLHFLVIDNYSNKNWTDLISEEDRLTPVKQNIKADEEFEINYSVKLLETPKNTVKIYFSYGKTDASGPSYLYQQDKDEYRHSDLRIENGILKMNRPGSKFMEYLKSQGCDGYVAGVISGKNSKGDDNWLCGRTYKFGDDAFSDTDFTYELYRAYDSIQDGKIFSIVDYYKNVENEAERIWISQDISSTVEYNTIFEESPISILGNKFGTSYFGASASSDGMIEWRYENNEEHPGTGWYVGNLDLSEWDVIRIEFDSEYPDDSLYVSLVQDGCTLDYLSDYQAETNVFEINLDGTKSTNKVPEDSVWYTSKPITEILIRTHLTEVEGTKKAKLKSVELKKYPQVSDHISVENVENGIQVTLKKTGVMDIWVTFAVDIMEDGKETGLPFSFIHNGNNLINQTETGTLSFIYPFTKAGSKYKFTVAPNGKVFETVAIVADKTSEMQLSDSETVSDFKVLYEENDDAEGAKRIIKLNSNPFNMFNDSSKYSYKLLCLNVYDTDMKWIYNFNVTESNVNDYIQTGKDFMSDSSSLGKTPQEFKEALNQSDKLIIIPHLEFSVENKDASSGAFVKSLGRFEYIWTPIE